MRSILLAIPLALTAQNCLIELETSYPVKLESTGPYQVIYDDGQIKTESRFAKNALIQEKNFGLVWGDEIHSARTFTVVPMKDSRILLNGTQYPGTLTFTLGKTIVNEVALEWPLHALMQKPMFNQLHPEALKALAITLRTDLANDNVPLTAKEIGYQGSSLLFQYPKVTASIIETQDKVMRYQGRVFPTTYCLDAAGKTANFAQIFRTADATPDGQVLKTASSTWKKTISKEELIEGLHMQGFKNLGFYKDPSSQKVYAVKLEDAKGPRVLFVERFMELLGLKSNQFNLQMDAKGFHFEGEGEGLGVGLCLKTAESLARQGVTTDEILRNCFQNIEIGLLEK